MILSARQARKEARAVIESFRVRCLTEPGFYGFNNYREELERIKVLMETLEIAPTSGLYGLLPDNDSAFCREAMSVNDRWRTIDDKQRTERAEQRLRIILQEMKPSSVSAFRRELPQGDSGKGTFDGTFDIVVEPEFLRFIFYFQPPNLDDRLKSWYATRDIAPEYARTYMFRGVVGRNTFSDPISDFLSQTIPPPCYRGASGDASGRYFGVAYSRGVLPIVGMLATMLAGFPVENPIIRTKDPEIIKHFAKPE